MNDFNPVEFGRLQAEVQALNRTVDRMSGQMDELMALANKGKGGFFMFMSTAAAIGSVLGWLASRYLK